jgi:hypothetical protein
MRDINTLRAQVDTYKIRRLSERWPDEEICSYYNISIHELHLILDLSL